MIVQSKLAPLRIPHSLWPREHLLATLDAALAHRATILHAPAGFGKTSSLARWRHSLRDRQIPVAWLSLDEHDTEPLQFLAYLNEAFGTTGALNGSPLTFPPDSVSGVGIENCVAALLTELAKTSTDDVLILDDFHLAASADVCDVVNRLVTQMPSNWHLVVSSREFPTALMLADLRAREELLEIGHLELRFSEAEIRSWIGPLVDTNTPTDWPAQLSARTEGWPIALQTVRRWLAEGARLSETLDQLSGRSADLVDYFLEQVFSDLRQAVRTFLLRTSILERINGDLANRLCGTNDAWKTLEELERRDLFVHSLDRERTWYRYHGLFAEFLRERLRRRRDISRAGLHRIASSWFLDQGHLTEAVQHAIASRHPDTIAELFESLGGWHYALKGHTAMLDRALSLVGESLLTRYPRLRLGSIFLTVRRGETERAQTMFEQMEAQLSEGDIANNQLHDELQIMRSTLNRYADKDATVEEIETLENLGESPVVEEDLMHAVRYNFLCVMYGQRGDFAPCMAAGDKAIRYFRAMGSEWGETFIYFHEGYACMAQGRLRDAEALYKVGLDLAVEHFGVNSDLAAIARCFLAETAYEKNDISEASQLLNVALPRIERFDAWLEVYAAAYTTAMKLARFGRNPEAAVEIRTRARATAAGRSLPRLRTIVDLQALELDILGRDKPTQDLRLQTSSLLTEGVSEQLIVRQLCTSVRARLHLLLGDTDSAAALLEEECHRTRNSGLARSFVSLTILRAITRWKQGEHDAAVAAFEAALEPSLFEGLKRPFIDEGEALAGVIGNLVHTSATRRGSRLRDRFLAELTKGIGSSAMPLETSPEKLTPREREVLRNLVQGRSNREIAEMIPMSVNTVKFHLKNIYGKLGVATRRDAAAIGIRYRQI